MAAKKPASAQKQPQPPRQKAKTGKKRKGPRKQATTSQPTTTRQKRTTAARKRRGREALSESKEENDLQQEFFSQQQLFRAAIEDSAKLLRQAAESALSSIREQTRGVVATTVQPTAPSGPEDPLKPLTDQFVEEAYKRAREMFDELGPAGTQAGAASAQTPSPSPETPTSDPGGDALATSARLMNQATQHLNMAIDSVMKEMDRRLRVPAENSAAPRVTPPRPKRP